MYDNYGFQGHIIHLRSDLFHHESVLFLCSPRGRSFTRKGKFKRNFRSFDDMSEYVSNLSLRGIKLYSSLGMRRGGREREIREYIQSFSTEPDGRREREEDEEKEELGDLLPSFILGKVMNVGIGPSSSPPPSLATLESPSNWTHTRESSSQL